MPNNNLPKKVLDLPKTISDFIKNKAPQIAKVEALRFISYNFKNQGFTDKSLQKWEKRKVDKESKRKSDKKTVKQDTGRAILVGHSSSSVGGHLKDSYTGASYPGQVVISTDKVYAEIHNYGGNAGKPPGFEMPQRQMIGPSHYLDQQINDKLSREIYKILKLD